MKKIIFISIISALVLLLSSCLYNHTRLEMIDVKGTSFIETHEITFSADAVEIIKDNI